MQTQKEDALQGEKEDVGEGKKENKVHKFRVFVSYSHEDRDKAEKVANILKEKGLEPIWDKNIRPGAAFTDAIKGLITHAHIFMPLITDNSRDRPWVHQETGYAMALNIPVLPVAIEKEPTEMIAELQAISVDAEDEELSSLSVQLDKVNLEHVVHPPPARRLPLVEVADWQEKRIELLANNANRIIKLGYHGHIRQHSTFSSFSIPDRDLEDPIWKERDGKHPRSEYYHYLLREERQAMERHARKEGCDLLIDPTFTMQTRLLSSKKSRLITLYEFLESMEDDKVRVVCSERGRKANIYLVGDWFVAESRLLRSGEGWRQTIFNWHSPTVLQCVQKFDETFETLHGKLGLKTRSSRKIAMDKIEKVIKDLKSEISKLEKSKFGGG
ncbi:MAG: toll/interleukin-1 receptor domain-containing protein [Candidatus Eremiobacteraeota bacterium]|nr:toll/interleukin-1 receptor domain-containing protein [Candidatus Eremiobacteraeota bacterium]